MRYTVAAQSSCKVRSSLQRRPSGLHAPLLTVRDLAIHSGRICCPTTQTLKAVCCLQTQSGHFRNASFVAPSLSITGLPKRRAQMLTSIHGMYTEKLHFSSSCRSSSVVEQLTADQQVIGSNPMVDFIPLYFPAFWHACIIVLKCISATPKLRKCSTVHKLVELPCQHVLAMVHNDGLQHQPACILSHQSMR